jgi:hypothetical protein
MALSEAFPSEIVPALRATRPRIPITARELVEWTYAEQKAHRGGETVMGNAAGISQTGIVIERLLLGCTVDTSGGGSGMWGSVYCDEDALTVHGILEDRRLISSKQRALLISYGEQRSAPDWQPLVSPLRCIPVPGRKGMPKGIYAHHGKTQIGSEITYAGDWPNRATARAARAAWPDAPRLRCGDEIIQHARQAYHDWYEALWALCYGLEAAGGRGLRRYSINGLGASCEPWNEKNSEA